MYLEFYIIRNKYTLTHTHTHLEIKNNDTMRISYSYDD